MSVLAAVTSMKPTRDPDHVISAFVRFRGLNRNELLSGIGKTSAVTRPRHELMWLLRDLTNLSFTDIGKAMGGRDYSTVVAGINNTEVLATEHPDYREQLLRTRAYILSYDPSVYEDRLDAASVLARRVLTDPKSDPVLAQPLATAMLTVAVILRSAGLTDAEARQAALTVIQNVKVTS